MTREEYLNELKSSIMSLTSDEQAEAIQYYSDYFDEADDDEKVMRELGTPEELAKTIIEKFANALVDRKKARGILNRKRALLLLTATALMPFTLSLKNLR